MHIITKRVLALCLVLTVILSGAGAAFAASESEAPVWIRGFFEEAGAEVEWDNTLRTITITLGPDTLVLIENSQLAVLNSDIIVLQHPITVSEGRSYIAASDLLYLLTFEAPYLSATLSTALLVIPMLMEMMSVAGVTAAIVDAEAGFTWVQGFGYADVANQVPVTEHTLFNLASVSKTFTAIAVMQLVEAGLLDLDEPVATYLPGFKLDTDLTGTGDYRNITTRMLLTHASGIHGDIMASGVLTTGSPCPGYTNHFLETIAAFPMASPELAAFAYANNSYTLLSILIATLMDYDDYYEGFVEYTQKRIFDPAGMERTTFAPEERHEPYLSQAYANAADLEDFLFYNAIAAGGIFSNAADMARFMHIILNGGTYDGSTLLSAESLEAMLEKQDGIFTHPIDVMSPNMTPGLGFLYLTGLDGFSSVGHPGNMVQFHTSMVFDVDSGLGVFVSANSTTGMAIVRDLASILLQTAIMEKTGTLDIPVSDVTVELAEYPIDAFHELHGMYVFPGAEDLGYVAAIDGVLHILGVPGVPFPMALFPMTDGSFINPDTGLRFWFVETDDAWLVYLGEFKSIWLGGRLSPEEIEYYSDGQGIEPWTGTYQAVTAQDNHVSLITHGMVDIDDNGFAFIRIYTLRGDAIFSLLVSLGVDGVYLGGFVFTEDEDGDVWLTFSGVTMRRVTEE
jgi:CubicO group peptidase (beta-lactamase class C family)